MHAAVSAGADAVYLGGKEFSARMNARNFDEAEMKGAVQFCHEHGVKLYVTLNTQIYDRKMEQALRYAFFLYQCGADALIVSDLGLISLLRRYLPDFELHASTQMAGHNAAAAEYLYELGVSRMVCARELSEKNLRTLCRNSPIEIEMFVHGALCASQSGGCLMSSLIGGRSGNRGECAQPCRLPYNGSYPLSLKDLCLAAHMRSLLTAGVASLKIEGRMKSPEYVSGVVAVYRRLIDERRDATAEELRQLAALFSRSGFTDGYFTGRLDESMLGRRTDEDKKAGKAVRTLKRSSERPLAEINAPVRTHTLPERIQAPEGAAHTASRGERNTARFYDPEAIPDTDYFDIIYLPLDRYDGRADGVLLPPVIPDSELSRVWQELERARERGARHVMVSNLGQLSLAARSGLSVHIDYRFNLYNGWAAESLSRYGDVLLSPELTLPQMRDIRADKNAIVYGRIPLMTLERPTGKRTLTDRRGIRFPVIREGGRELLLNSVPVYMADRQSELRRAGIVCRHFLFTIETRRQTEDIIKKYQEGAPAAGAVTRIKAK